MSGSDGEVPPAFHVMAKPTGARCNLACAYCFFLKKEELYPDSTFRMTDGVMEEYIRQTIEGHRVPQVTIAWQGGEPTLMGLDFFQRAVEVQKKYAKPKTRIENTFQTNGILLDDEWCHFFHENQFLVGLSMDGPAELHDTYRRDRRGRGTFDRVLKAARLLQKHQVEYNILCAVNSTNADYPQEVYRFFRDELSAQYIQFIPIVERNNETGFQEGNTVTDRSVRPDQWGRFLIEIFDEWVRRDVGRMFVLNFDGALAGWLGMAGTVCVFSPTCGLGVALEHNGDLYSCDHFVEPDHLLGNILTTPLAELVGSEKQRRFGAVKRDTLPRYCRECAFLAICNGECPKNRFIETPDGEAGLNYLCKGYKAFFAHADRPMRMMADLLRQGRFADEVMPMLAAREKGPANQARVGRNDPCPCGSGLKYKKCCGLRTR
ncbi:anaerobic sulfatase maturase [Methanoculleus taiwanensis]|uniref:Anaerobic sulfatase maturase n=1 Tax=Methanoculleus taiwanensis TaxID=1550565 RepID=A0A498H2P9_9EURY|nr:anaerobic sulfatase maturase [Methanoculleus taiwanensis]RXE56757.1 anaerobic sulfatase maturase [Methanoculleus taiwanensis]